MIDEEIAYDQALEHSQRKGKSASTLSGEVEGPAAFSNRDVYVAARADEGRDWPSPLHPSYDRMSPRRFVINRRKELVNPLGLLAFQIVFVDRLAFCFILDIHLRRSTTLSFVQRHPLVKRLSS